MHSRRTDDGKRRKSPGGRRGNEVATMEAPSLASKRLRKEYVKLQRHPVEYVRAAPLESDILEWHYVIIGTPGTPYENGYYHGTLKFPEEFPFKPPAIKMLTPSGRFKTDRRICLSMSDYHPETWCPAWGVTTILVGLYSFMLEDERTTGGIETTDDEKRHYAAQSLAFNCKSEIFCKLFPDLVVLNEPL